MYGEAIVLRKDSRGDLEVGRMLQCGPRRGGLRGIGTCSLFELGVHTDLRRVSSVGRGGKRHEPWAARDNCVALIYATERASHRIS